MFMARLGQRNSQRPSAGEPSRAGARSAGSTGRRDRRDSASRRTAGSAPDARAGCGTPRGSCRRTSSSCTRGRGVDERTSVIASSGKSRISAKKSRRSCSSGARRRSGSRRPAHARWRPVSRVARTRRRRASSPKSRAERNRPSNAYAHPWYWHTRFAHGTGAVVNERTRDAGTHCEIRAVLRRSRAPPTTATRRTPVRRTRRDRRPRDSVANQSHSFAKMLDRSRS